MIDGTKAFNIMATCPIGTNDTPEGGRATVE
jgi:hypothetical protein